MRYEKANNSYTCEHFGEILFVLHTNNRKYLNDTFAKHGLSLVQSMCILTILDRDDITQRELTEMLYLTKSGITKAINKLEDDGFIIKEKSKKDQRKYVLKLTKKGCDIIPTLIKIHVEWEEKIGLHEVDDKFIETLKKLMYNSIELNSSGI